MQGVHHTTYRWCNGSASGALVGADVLPRKRGNVLEPKRNGTASAPPRARASREGFFVVQVLCHAVFATSIEVEDIAALGCADLTRWALLLCWHP